MLDPKDDRDEATKRLHPRYIPLLDYTMLLYYTEYFIRACTTCLPNTTARPSLDVVIDAEFKTRDYACKLLRDAHLEGHTMSLTMALGQALRDCHGFWHFTLAHSRSEINKANKKAKLESDARQNSSRNGNGNGNNGYNGNGNGRRHMYFDDSNWKKNDKDEWVFTFPQRNPKGGKAGKGKGKGDRNQASANSTENKS